MVRGCGHTLQMYFQSGALPLIIARACMISWAPFDVASPPHGENHDLVVGHTQRLPYGAHLGVGASLAE